jgi:hypothetical protein
MPEYQRLTEMIGVTIEVHHTVGRGLLESLYVERLHRLIV